MAEARASVRRDPRYRVRPGSCRIVFEHPVTGRQHVAKVSQMGIAGFSFTLEEPVDGLVGTELTGIRFEIGESVLPGDFVVKYTDSLNGGRSIYGGLFFPADPECALRLEGIIEGLAAADGSPQ